MVELKVQACDLGVSRGRFGTCSVDSKAEPSQRPALAGPQRAARAVAGIGFLAISARVRGSRVPAPVGAATAWFGVSHVVAAATAFDGCPELGAVPSALLRRDVATECGPWDWLDRSLGLRND